MSVSVDIRKSFGGFRLDVRFEAGNETLALLGASGSGKSMTLKCIAGVEKPDEGKIVLNGRVLFDSDRRVNLPPQQRGTGYLFQNYALFPNMTVEENIAAGICAPKSERELAIRAKIRAFRLEGLEKRYPSQLSGGQQQRVALARMLASRPSVLMLDEPLSALDSYLRWQVEQELSSVLEQFGGTALYVSHNRDEVYRLCDRIAIIADGTVQTVGEKWDLFEDPGTLAAARLTGCKNISRAEKRSDRTLMALDWDTLLTADREVPDGLRYVGVRAHYFVPAGEETERNVVRGKTARVTEDTFSVIVRYSCGKNGNASIRWEIDKNMYRRMGVRTDTLLLKIPPKDLLLLRES